MNIVANWSYPTAVKMGRGRIKELADACKSLGMKKPLLITDRGLAPMAITQTALDVLEHTPDDGAVVREFHRLLKPGGLYLHLFWQWQGWLGVVLGSLLGYAVALWLCAMLRDFALPQATAFCRLDAARVMISAGFLPGKFEL